MAYFFSWVRIIYGTDNGREISNIYVHSSKTFISAGRTSKFVLLIFSRTVLFWEFFSAIRTEDFIFFIFTDGRMILSVVSAWTILNKQNWRKTCVCPFDRSLHFGRTDEQIYVVDFFRPVGRTILFLRNFHGRTSEIHTIRFFRWKPLKRKS